MPAAGAKARAAEPGASSPGPVTGPGPRQPAKGSEVRMVRCAAHGIAYDSEREVCPARARGSSASGEPASGLRLSASPLIRREAST
jgi:hypothetical protein